jgi:Na+/proline symporter
MVWSGVFVFLQFALFLALGVGLWAFYGGQSPAELGLSRGDEIFPMYILERMPQGLRGLLLAGIIAAAMSTLSSSLNALAGSTMIDLLERFGHARPDPAASLRMSRYLTLGWAVALMGFAMLFEGTDNPVVELGLGIAGFTYGGLLGAFLLGLLNRRARQRDAVPAFLFTIALMTVLIFGLWWSASENQWHFIWRPVADVKAALDLKAIAWPLYPLIGAVLTVGLGSLLALRPQKGGGSLPQTGAEPALPASDLTAPPQRP